MGKPLPRNNKKKNIAFFVNVSSGFSSSWTSFHRYHPASWIFVIIYVEKTLGQWLVKCVEKIFKKLLKITEHIRNIMNFFWFPGKDTNISDIFYKKKKFI